MSEITLTDKTFEVEVLQSPVPVLVDFWAPWCGPCRLQGPIIEELARELDSSKAKVAKLNVDENPASAQQYGILSIPSLLVFRAGKVVEQFVGVQAKDKLQASLNKHVA
ncbi:MAG: thioredoxin [Candidatus Kerfeldbacteria bacterium]|nr:thioredoxin [Candidatus Kerfeldbacteria bacterium]